LYIRLRGIIANVFGWQMNFALPLTNVCQIDHEHMLSLFTIKYFYIEEFAW